MSGTSPQETDARPTVYVETSVISYLAATPSGDVITRAHQKSTRSWWVQRGYWDLFTSTVAVGEIVRGDHRTAVRRLEMLADLALLPVTPDAKALAAQFLTRGTLPAKARLDAEHIAVAAVNRLAYIVTWNLKHIANPAIRTRVEALCLSEGYQPPIACTPEELLASLTNAKRSHR
ncbi:MAG TPA: type II toxin-antitoxin system VapC family toxin [Longimicrobium sp.]|nr:type II toxin-antitoxin system VapC family toxin [Longimicrobium sp.]